MFPIILILAFKLLNIFLVFRFQHQSSLKLIFLGLSWDNHSKIFPPN